MAIESNQRRKRATYLSLMGGFAGLFAATAAKSGDKGKGLELSAIDLTMLGLATYRGARIISLDQVTEPLRAPVAQPDGDGSEPKGEGVQQALGELITCPTCIGTWIAAGLVFGLRVAPAPTRAAMALLSAGGIAELLDFASMVMDSATKANTARAARDQIPAEPETSVPVPPVGQPTPISSMPPPGGGNA